MSNQKVKIKKAGLMVLFLQMLFLVGFLLLPNIGQAADDQQSGGITFKAQVPIGKYEGEPITGYSIGNYINEFYKYAIGTVGILAATVIMWSGFMWIMAGGNPQKITEAKTWLTGALSGLVLAMTCALILNTINPELIKIRSIVPEPIKKDSGCCQIVDSSKKLHARETTSKGCDEYKDEYETIKSVVFHSDKVKNGDICIAKSIEKIYGCCEFQSTCDIRAKNQCPVSSTQQIYFLESEKCEWDSSSNICIVQ